MKKTNKSNSWIFTFIMALLAILFGFLSFIPINVPVIQTILGYFNPKNLLNNLPLWIFFNSLIAIYSYSPKLSMLNSALFNVICFLSYTLSSILLTQILPKEMFLTWFLFTIVCMFVCYITWSSTQSNTRGIVTSTLLLTLLFSTSFTYTKSAISNVTILNLLLYVFLVILLYKGTKETLIMVILSVLLAILLNTIQIQIIFTKSACINYTSMVL